VAGGIMFPVFVRPSRTWVPNKHC